MIRKAVEYCPKCNRCPVPRFGRCPICGTKTDDGRQPVDEEGRLVPERLRNGRCVGSHQADQCPECRQAVEEDPDALLDEVVDVPAKKTIEYDADIQSRQAEGEA